MAQYRTTQHGLSSEILSLIVFLKWCAASVAALSTALSARTLCGVQSAEKGYRKTAPGQFSDDAVDESGELCTGQCAHFGGQPAINGYTGAF